MNKKNNLALYLLALCAQPLAAAAEPANNDGLSGEASLGFLSTSGNTSTSSGSAKLIADYMFGEGTWKNGFTANAIHNKDEDTTTAERYTVTDKLDWNWDEKNYLFVSGEWEKDLFGGIRERTSETVGYGRHVLTGPVHLLDLEIGAGARQTEEQDTGLESDDAIGRAFGKYQWKISDTSAFAQSVKVESGSANTYTESLTELKLSIIGNLFATLSYTVKNNSQVSEDSENTDTFTAVALTYQFGKKE